MLRRICIFILILTFYSCDYYLINSYKNGVSYINPNSAIEVEAFEACYEEGILPSYFSRNKPTQFIHGKDSLRNYFFNEFHHEGYTNESGYVTVRFVVNCQGEIGRYEIHSIGPDYKKKKFPSLFTDQLLKLTSQLQDWQSLQIGDTKFDSYFHLGFKIENGTILEILP